MNETALAKYKNFKEIANALELPSSSKVVLHIDGILNLEAYLKYNSLHKCVVHSLDDYKKCVDYIQQAANYTYSYYTAMLYIGYAWTHSTGALASARTYNDGGYRCDEYVSALSTLDTQLGSLVLGSGSYNTSRVNAALETLSSIYSELSDIQFKVADILDAVPEL